MPFEHVPDLISRRSVLLDHGWAYVPRSDVLSIIISSYRNMLERELLHTASALPFIGEDQRIFSLLEAISAGEDIIDGPMTSLASAKLEKLSSSEIDSVSFFIMITDSLGINSFPSLYASNPSKT